MESFEVGPKLNPKDFIKVETPFEDLIRSLAVELVAKGFNPRIPYIVTVEENHYVISQEIPVEPKLYLTSEQINMIRKANPNLEKVNLEELGIIEIGEV